MASARETILNRIQANLGSKITAAPPAPPEVWPRTAADRLTLCQRFAEEFRAVHGEPLLKPHWPAAREDFRQLVEKAGWKQALVMDRSLAWQLARDVPGLQTITVAENPAPRDWESIPVSILEAECLLADTGSSVIICRSPGERLACYLPPACVIVATADRLHEHLPAAWDALGPKIRDPQMRGELVIVTGPSRTADIEKILILGVHGPKRVITYLITAP